MIAFFVSGLERARRAAQHLRDFEDGVDGPFRIFHGMVGDAEIRVFVVEPDHSAAYAAARIAARRGAKALSPIVDATATPGVASRAGLAPGAIVPVARVWDLSACGGVMRLLPDSAEEFPVPVDELFPSSPSWKSGDGVACCTTPLPMRSRLLARETIRRLGDTIFDGQLTAYAAAAADTGIPLRPAALVTRILTRNGMESDVPLRVERGIEEMFAGLASR